MLRRLALVLGLVCATGLGLAATAGATTFYVSPAGSDGNAGTSPSTAWKTVQRADSASLAPGDSVLFQGGATFADQTLMPAASGADGAPIVFGSYGTGRANLPGGIWFSGKSWLTFDGLAVSPASPGDLSAIQASASGPGSTHVTIENCALTGVRIGIDSANPNDGWWTITGNLVQHTRDSGAIVLGHDLSFLDNTILDTGEDASIAYGKHGVYAKGPSLTFVGNTIRRFSDDGISLRFRDATVERNTISDGPIGVAWFQVDPSAGTSTIDDNTISNTTASGIYVSPSDEAGATRESFRITSNTVSVAAGNALDLEPTSGNATISGNVFTGAAVPVAHIHRPGGSYVEQDNDFWNTAGTTQIDFDGSWGDLANLRALSGQGDGDASVDPQFFSAAGTPLAAPTGLAQTGSTPTSVTLAWTAPADARVTGYTVTGPDGVATPVAATSYTASGLACGTKTTFRVAATDAAGDVSGAVSVDATTAACPDTTAPWVLITSPTNGQSVSPATTVAADATDASGVHDVTFWVDGNQTCVDASAPYTCATTLAAGAHTLLVRATDNAGNVAWMSVQVTATAPDTTSPWVLITSPTKGQTVSSPATVAVDASDASGIHDVTFWVDGNQACVDTSAPYSCTVELSSGWHTLLARATDGAGNVAWMSVQVRRP